jgi:hypothetical protein
MTRRRSRIGRLVGFGVVLAALAVSSAQAQTAPQRPDDRAGPRGPGAAVVVPVRPDDRAEPRGPGIGPSVVYTVDTSAFHWRDAGVGFGAATGIVLLAGGFLLVARRHRKSSLPAV